MPMCAAENLSTFQKKYYVYICCIKKLLQYTLQNTLPSLYAAKKIFTAETVAIVYAAEKAAHVYAAEELVLVYTAEKLASV